MTAEPGGVEHRTDEVVEAVEAAEIAEAAEVAETAEVAGLVERAAVGKPVVPSAWNVANVLTVSRLVLVPLFVLALFTADGVDVFWRYVATGVFALAALTDRVDGWVARKYGLVTDFGKIADPIADKALVGAALVGLNLLGELPWWITIVIAVRELGITVLRFWVIRLGVIAASRGGKVKTLAQVVAIGAYLLPLPEAFDPVCWTLMGIALVLTVVTGADYVVRALRLRANRGAAAP